MTRSTYPDAYPLSFSRDNAPDSHPGVARAEAAFESFVALKDYLKTVLTTARGLSALLLAALVSALVVVANQLIDTWADGHLLAAWTLMWAIVFVSIGWLAPVVKNAVSWVLATAIVTQRRAALASSEAAFLATAQADPRVMAELQAAILRHEAQTGKVAVEARTLSVDAVPTIRRPAGLGHLRYL